MTHVEEGTQQFTNFTRCGDLKEEGNFARRIVHGASLSNISSHGIPSFVL